MVIRNLSKLTSIPKSVLYSFLLAVVIVTLLFFQTNRSGPLSPKEPPTTTPTAARPPIVDHFACSDYCPGPLEQYMVRIYQGVEDSEKCGKIGGTPYSYHGWGEFRICLVPGEELPPEPR